MTCCRSVSRPTVRCKHNAFHVQLFSVVSNKLRVCKWSSEIRNTILIKLYLLQLPSTSLTWSFRWETEHGATIFRQLASPITLAAFRMAHAQDGKNERNPVKFAFTQDYNPSPFTQRTFIQFNWINIETMTENTFLSLHSSVGTRPSFRSIPNNAYGGSYGRTQFDCCHATNVRRIEIHSALFVDVHFLIQLKRRAQAGRDLEGERGATVNMFEWNVWFGAKFD